MFSCSCMLRKFTSRCTSGIEKTEQYPMLEYIKIYRVILVAHCGLCSLESESIYLNSAYKLERRARYLFKETHVALLRMLPSDVDVHIGRLDGESPYRHVGTLIRCPTHIVAGLQVRGTDVGRRVGLAGRRRSAGAKHRISSMIRDRCTWRIPRPRLRNSGEPASKLQHSVARALLREQLLPRGRLPSLLGVFRAKRKGLSRCATAVGTARVPSDGVGVSSANQPRASLSNAFCISRVMITRGSSSVWHSCLRCHWATSSAVVGVSGSSPMIKRPSSPDCSLQTELSPKLSFRSRNSPSSFSSIARCIAVGDRHEI